jgi:hypothetical protein
VTSSSDEPDDEPVTGGEASAVPAKGGSRRRRRATRPATGPAPEAVGGSDGGQTKDDTDAGWGEAPDRDRTRDQHEQWLHEQRPPHWE